MFAVPGSKLPCDARRIPDRRAADETAKKAARDAGNPRWDKVKSPSGVKLATDDPGTHNDYLDEYRRRHRDKPVNLALAAGRSRLLIVDCDTPEQVAAFLADADADPDTQPTVTTPGARAETKPGEPERWNHHGGGHYYFVVPEGVELPDCPDKMAIGDGESTYDVKAGDSYALIPPSQRPEGDYRLTGTVEVAPGWLLDKIAEFGAARRERATRVRTDHDGGAVAEWGSQITWADILGGTDWMPTGKADTCGCDTWTAPGVHDSEKSATAHEPGCAVWTVSPDPPLHIWTSHSFEPFEECARVADTEGHFVTRLDAVAAVDFDGNTDAVMAEHGLFEEPATFTYEDLGLEDPKANGDNVNQRKGEATVGRTARVIRSTPADQIEDDAPTWAWEYAGAGRIMLGTLAIFAGRPAVGKSTAARWFAAGFTTGTHEGCFHGQPQTVAYIATEEPWNYTIKPSLRAAGADLSRVLHVYAEHDGKESRMLAVEDEQALTEHLLEVGATVVILDPLMGTIAGKTDIYRNNETREALDPWKRIAERIDGVVIGIAHLTKSPSGDPLAAIQGSSAFGEVARSVLAFAKDDDSNRVMSQTKNSAGPEDLALEYAIDTQNITTSTGKVAEVSKFAITGSSDRTVDDILRDKFRGRGGSSGGAAAGQWLAKYLADGPRWAAQGITDGERDGFTKHQLTRARRACQIESKKATGTDGKWYWATPEQIKAEELPPERGPVTLPDTVPVVKPDPFPGPARSEVDDKAE